MYNIEYSFRTSLALTCDRSAMAFSENTVIAFVLRIVRFEHNSFDHPTISHILDAENIHMRKALMPKTEVRDRSILGDILSGVKVSSRQTVDS